MKKLLLFIAAAAILVVGCRAEVNVLVDINEDGTGAATFEFGLDEEFLGVIESMGGSADEIFADMDIAEEGGTVVEREDGSMTYTGVKKEFTDISEITADLEGESTDDAPFKDFTFTMDDKQAEITATVSAPEQDLGDMGLDPSALTGDIFSANFILSMPGTVKEHNADEVLADGRLRWELPLLGGEKSIHAVSEFGGGALWWLWILLGVVLIVGAIAVIAAIVLGKRQSKGAVEDAASQYPEPAGAPIETPESEEVEEAVTEAVEEETPAEEPAVEDADDASDEEI
ncbi:MAG: hypothetical protein ABFS21_04095 [Actinomycetota bacterium]